MHACPEADLLVVLDLAPVVGLAVLVTLLATQLGKRAAAKPAPHAG